MTQDFIFAELANLMLCKLMMAGRKGPATVGLHPILCTWDAVASYHLHSSHRFLSTWGVVMLEKIKKHKKELSRVLSCHVAVSSE